MKRGHQQLPEEPSQLLAPCLLVAPFCLLAPPPPLLLLLLLPAPPPPPGWTLGGRGWAALGPLGAGGATAWA